MRKITKRTGEKQDFDFNKIEKAIRSAFSTKNSTNLEEEIQLVLKVVNDSVNILYN